MPVLLSEQEATEFYNTGMKHLEIYAYLNTLSASQAAVRGHGVTLTETPPFPAHVGKCTGNQDQSCVVHVVVRRVIHWPNGTISKNLSPCIFTSQIPGTL